MSGYRVLYGFGQLPRKLGESPDKIPDGLISGGTTKIDSVLSYLKYRFGGGVDLSHNRNIQVAHAWDLGQREATITTQGIREVEWSANGMVMPEHLKWLEYLFCTESIEITGGSSYDSLSSHQQAVVSSTQYSAYQDKINNPELDAPGKNTIRIYYYRPLNGPNHQIPHGKAAGMYQYRGLFDMITIKYNEETGIKGDNEITLLLGCIINSVTISYENGSDAAIKFSINGYAMVDPTMVFNTKDTEYDIIRDWVAEDLIGDVFTFGCLSTMEENAPDYEPVAETDSSSLDISTGVNRIADCGKAWYGAYSLGNLEYSVSTSTYSDDPNKYMAKVYGISNFTGVTDFKFPGKVPYLIPLAKIHTQDTLYPAPASKFLDIDMQKVATSSLNRTYAIGGDAVMDEPDLAPRKVQIVVMSST